MNKYECECTYCGKVWVVEQLFPPRPNCISCKDKNVKVRKQVRVNYYPELDQQKEPENEYKIEFTD